MENSSGLLIDRNRFKAQEFSLVVRVLIAMILAAALVAWAPGNASAAGTGETAWSHCGNSSYWEYFFAQMPDIPNVAQAPCFLPVTGANTLPASSPSLYWEYFFTYDPVGPHIAPPFALPVTGVDTRPDSSASQYWEYFFNYAPNGPRTLDLGAGYSLILDGAQGKIVAPAHPDTTVKRTDLGAGYVLEETAYGARIIAPATTPQLQPPFLAVQKTYLGAGYWLETGPDGGRIVQGGSR